MPTCNPSIATLSREAETEQAPGSSQASEPGVYSVATETRETLSNKEGES